MTGMKALALAALLVGGSLAACATQGTPAQIAEKGDITVLSAYTAVANACNALEAAQPAKAASAEAVKDEAWAVVAKAHQAAKLGQDLAPFLTELQFLLTSAKAL